MPGDAPQLGGPSYVAKKGDEDSADRDLLAEPAGWKSRWYVEDCSPGDFRATDLLAEPAGWKSRWCVEDCSPGDFRATGLLAELFAGLFLELLAEPAGWKSRWYVEDLQSW